jgi:hypothetical protein
MKMVGRMILLVAVLLVVAVPQARSQSPACPAALSELNGQQIPDWLSAGSESPGGGPSQGGSLTPVQTKAKSCSMYAIYCADGRSTPQLQSRARQ